LEATAMAMRFKLDVIHETSTAETPMKTTRRTLGRLALGFLGATAFGATAYAESLPAPFDKPGSVKIALVRYVSTGDFFQSYLSGVENQAAALGVGLRVFDSRQNAKLQVDMVDQAILLGVNGIIIQHGWGASMKAAAQRAVDAGIKVVAFDVNVENDKIPQIEQSDRDLARLVLEQAINDNGDRWKAGYVYGAGIAPLDRRDETWRTFKAKYPGIEEVARFGTFDNPVASLVANQARSVIAAHPNITVIFAPYDEFAKGAKIAIDQAGLSSKIKIYSADISTSDIAAMREQGSAWVATAATNPALVGQISVRALAMLIAGEDPGHNIIVHPTLITQAQLKSADIKSIEELAAKLPQFARANIAVPKWMPLPGAK
jgi:simple sugar transport system substrate-binding protein